MLQKHSYGFVAENKGYLFLLPTNTEKQGRLSHFLQVSPHLETETTCKYQAFITELTVQGRPACPKRMPFQTAPVLVGAHSHGNWT